MFTGLHQLLAGLVRSSAAPGQTLAETGTHALACQRWDALNCSTLLILSLLPPTCTVFACSVCPMVNNYCDILLLKGIADQRW